MQITYPAVFLCFILTSHDWEVFLARFDPAKFSPVLSFEIYLPLMRGDGKCIKKSPTPWLLALVNGRTMAGLSSANTWKLRLRALISKKR